MVEWRVEPGLLKYPAGLAAMEARAEAIHEGRAAEMVWLVEHPPLYTAGTSARSDDLLDPRFPVYEAGRGGQYTYHGPGQRVGYVLLDLRERGRDVRAYVHQLEEWLIRTLALLGVTGERREGRVGIWVDRGGGREDKIAAIGVRLRRWVSYHGVALNVAPDLGHFGGIVPCGIRQHGVTSLADLGVTSDMGVVDSALRLAFASVFGGQAVSLSASPSHGFSKAVQPSLMLEAGIGVAGDAHAGQTVKHRSRVAVDPTQPNLRQVHLIAAETLAELAGGGFSIQPGDLGENILTRGLDLISLPRDTLLEIGGVQLRVTGLRNPCGQLDDFRPGLMKALLGRAADGSLIRKAGIMSVVERGGRITSGDRIAVHLPPLPHHPLERV